VGRKEKNNETQTLSTVDLPSGWELATIGGLVGEDGVFADGDWVESKDQDPNGDVRLIQLADIGDGEYRDRSSRFLTYKKALELRCTFIDKGDVLVARMPDPLGRACIFPGDKKTSVTVVDVCIIRPGNDDISKRWLMYFINAPAFRAAVASLESGSTRKRISRKNLARISFPVPPSDEQKRIVAEIEKQFSRLDEAVDNLKRVKANLKRYKASVLKAAVEGKLTEEWRKEHPDVEPADKLLERILAERRKKWEEAELAKIRVRGKQSKDDKWKKKYKEPAVPLLSALPNVPNGWEFAGIEQLLPPEKEAMKTGPFGSLLKKHEHRPEGIPVLGIENIQAMEFVPGSKIHITKKKAEELNGYSVASGDILISRSGTVGEVCVVPGNIGQARISTNLMKISLAKDGMSSEFFTFLFNGSPFVLSQVSELCKGSTRDFLNQDILKRLVFILPPVEEQKLIIQEVDQRFTIISGIERELARNLRRAERLRQSILKKAFSGQLVS